MAELKDWATNAADNNDAPPDGWPEGMAYQNVNNSAREGMAVLARHFQDTSGALETAASSTSLRLVVEPYGSYGTLEAGDRLSFKLGVNVGANATLVVGSGGASHAILDRKGSAIKANVLSSGDIVDVVFVGNNRWRALGVENPAVTTVGSDIATGMIVPYGSNTAPAGFLGCDGSAVSRTTYDDLFDVIGTTYGAGDGSTTFNLPDLVGKFPLGDGVGWQLGSTGGSADAIVVSHTHADTFSTSSAGSHSHAKGTLAAGAHTHGVNGSNVDGTTADVFRRGGASYGTGNTSSNSFSSISGSTASAGSHSHSINGSVSSTGDSGTNANLPPYVAICYIIKT